MQHTLRSQMRKSEPTTKWFRFCELLFMSLINCYSYCSLNFTLVLVKSCNLVNCNYYYYYYVIVFKYNVQDHVCYDVSMLLIVIIYPSSSLSPASLLCRRRLCPYMIKGRHMNYVTYYVSVWVYSLRTCSSCVKYKLQYTQEDFLINPYHYIPGHVREAIHGNHGMCKFQW